MRITNFTPVHFHLKMAARDRGQIWTHEEILSLLSIWGDNTIQTQLLGTARNNAIFDNIVIALRDAGYTRTAQQCRCKIKGLKSEYRAIKDANRKSGNGQVSWKYFERMDCILGTRDTSNPQALFDSTRPGDVESVMKSTAGESQSIQTFNESTYSMMYVDTQLDFQDTQDESLQSTSSATTERTLLSVQAGPSSSGSQVTETPRMSAADEQEEEEETGAQKRLRKRRRIIQEEVTTSTKELMDVFLQYEAKREKHFLELEKVRAAKEDEREERDLQFWREERDREERCRREDSEREMRIMEMFVNALKENNKT